MPSFTVFKGDSSGKIQRHTTTRTLAPDECLVKITHSCLCFTDVHVKKAGIALGHEGVGVIEEVGSGVTAFKKGDRAGWGYNHSSCAHCQHCLSGMDTFCFDRALYGEADLDQGSLGSHYVGKETFLFAIPDAVPSDVAAPLMCGGATVYNALALHNVRPFQRVGVIGIGGLGHLAIQFAAKMGCEVVVFSGSDSKKQEATDLGASEFHAVKGIKSGEELLKAMNGKTVDQLMVTTSAQPDWSLYLPVITRGGILCPLSVSDDNLVIEYTPLIMQGIRIWSGLVADRLTQRNMLAFAARHGIRPILQHFKLNEQGIEEAFEVLESGKMRYRGVLVAEE